ncbi:hypothetical protein [Priestia flexa]|uniref:hypothetical protein n=1 Tax=Priestia flexa TaxID=86664 RepID=UPI001CFD313E|nr:hypothetical protein [Priestia flexa]
MLIQVLTHSGQEHEITVEGYDPVEVNQQINDTSVYTVLIGDKIFSRIDIKYVGPKEVE